MNYSISGLNWLRNTIYSLSFVLFANLMLTDSAFSQAKQEAVFWEVRLQNFNEELSITCAVYNAVTGQQIGVTITVIAYDPLKPADECTMDFTETGGDVDIDVPDNLLGRVNTNW